MSYDHMVTNAQQVQKYGLMDSKLHLKNIS